jgi:hypothetical protein
MPTNLADIPPSGCHAGINLREGKAMKFNNVEAKKFPGHNYYVGYAGGRIYHIHKTNSSYGNWIAWPVDGGANLYGFTLAEVSNKLETVAVAAKLQSTLQDAMTR